MVSWEFFDFTRMMPATLAQHHAELRSKISAERNARPALVPTGRFERALLLSGARSVTLGFGPKYHSQTSCPLPALLILSGQLRRMR